MAGRIVRPLDGRDARSILELAAPELPELHLGEADLVRNLFEDPDARGETALGLFDASRLLGVACGVVRGADGYVKLLVVEAGARRQGLGSLLLNQLELAMARVGATSSQTDGAAPVYFLPGLPSGSTDARAFLERRGYREVETRLSVTAELGAIDLETAGAEMNLGRQGIEIRRAEPGDRDLVVPWVLARFSREWAVELEFAFRRAEVELHLAIVKRRLVGFAAARIWALNAFGPMGTDPEFEGRGIGGVLLKRCLADLRSAGEMTSLIPWIGPEEFYGRKAGARRRLEYALLSKPLRGVRPLLGV